MSRGGFHELHLVVPSVLSGTAAAQQLPNVSEQTAGLWSSRCRSHQGFQLRHHLLQSCRLSWRGLPSHLLWLAHQHQASSQPLSLLQLPQSWLWTQRHLQLCVWSHNVLKEIHFYWISTNCCCHEKYVYWSTFTFHDSLLNETKSNSLITECIDLFIVSPHKHVLITIIQSRSLNRTKAHKRQTDTGITNGSWPRSTEEQEQE